MTDPKELITRARELCDAATPGPWSVEVITGSDELLSGLDHDDILSRGIEAGGVGLNTGVEYEMFSEGDAALIAAARTIVPELSDALAETYRDYNHQVYLRDKDREASWKHVANLEGERDKALAELRRVCQAYGLDIDDDSDLNSIMESMGNIR